MSILLRLRRDEGGATMVEYGLMVALIAIVALAAVELLGGSISAIFTRTSTELNSVP